MRYASPRSARPRVVDLFAGAGLFSHAFDREGFSVVRAIEIDRHAAATYALNLGDRVEVADVTKVRPEGRCEVIIAGPPCQGFSTLGKRDANDPRNRLTLSIARWAAAMQPRVVVIENVAAFLASRQWHELARRLRRLGYRVSADVHDAVEFGVAQRRARSVTFAVRGRAEVVLGRGRRKVVTVEDVWKDLPATPNGRGLNVVLRPTKLGLARMRVIPPGGDRRDIMQRAPHLAPPSWWRTAGDLTDVWGRMEWDQPANTLRTEFVNPSKGRYLHPEEHRGISLREAARVHSIPDGFEFADVRPYVVARQIGNSVPPSLGRAIARAVRTAINY